MGVMRMLHRTFSLAGTAVKESGMDAQPDAEGTALRGLGSFPDKQKIAFVSRKPYLQKTWNLNFTGSRTQMHRNL